MTTYHLNSFPNIGYLTASLSGDDLIPIFSEIEKIQNNFDIAKRYNQNLIGNIEKEFELIDCRTCIENLIFPIAERYGNLLCLPNSNFLQLKDIWVNFQKKYEFNPQHNHSGDISFVIWINIPYDINVELLNSPGRDSAKNVAGHFSFHYTDVLGNICSHALPIDQQFENNLIMFPSKMLHSVYPFYSSDEYRISIAGNFANYQGD